MFYIKDMFIIVFNDFFINIFNIFNNFFIKTKKFIKKFIVYFFITILILAGVFILNMCQKKCDSLRIFDLLLVLLFIFVLL
jgi:hypothetical protein